MAGNTKYSREQMAMALCDALFEGDRSVADRLGVTRQTLFYWRVKMENDPEFLSTFNGLREKRLNAWSEQLTPALASCVAYVQRAASEANHRNPDTIKAISGAMMALSAVLTDGVKREVMKVEHKQKMEDRQ